MQFNSRDIRATKVEDSRRASDNNRHVAKIGLNS
jgi:hypothetical protein